MKTSERKVFRCAIYSSKPAAIALNIYVISVSCSFRAGRNLPKKPTWE
jgi:hypothetical protein